MIGLTTIEKVTNTTSFTKYIACNETANDLLRNLFVTSSDRFYRDVPDESAALFFLSNIDWVLENAKVGGILPVLTKVAKTAVPYIREHQLTCWVIKKTEELFYKVSRDMPKYLVSLFSLKQFKEFPEDFLRLWDRDHLNYIPGFLCNWPITEADRSNYSPGWKGDPDSGKVPCMGRVPIDVLRDWMAFNPDFILQLLRVNAVELYTAVYSVQLGDCSAENIRSCVLTYKSIFDHLYGAGSVQAKDKLEDAIDHFLFREKVQYTEAYEIAKLMYVLKPLGLKHMLDQFIEGVMLLAIRKVYNYRDMDVAVPALRKWPYNQEEKDIALYCYSAFISLFDGIVTPSSFVKSSTLKRAYKLTEKHIKEIWDNIDRMHPEGLLGIPFQYLIILMNTLPFENKVDRRDKLLNTLSTFTLNIVV